MKKRHTIILILLFTVFLGFYVTKTFVNKSKSTANYDEESYGKDFGDTVDSNEKTPEQVIKEMEARENPKIEGPLSAKIISPEGEAFQVGQARFYKAKIENGLSNTYKKTECSWEFYINEYSEEVLYKEQNVPMTGDTCGFTSTFIDKMGKLRVSLETVLSDRETGEVLDTFTTDRTYIVN